jgi:hypothetical protein
MAEARIRGLVKLMQVVRRQAAAGLSPEAAVALERDVARQLEAVERLCVRQGVSPEELPAPSRDAWEFLRSFRATPISGQLPQGKKSSLTGLAASCRSFLNQLAEADSASLMTRFLDEAAAWLARARTRLAAAEGTPAALPEAQQRLLARLEQYARPGMAARMRDNAACFRTALIADWPTGFLRPPRPLV